MGQGGSDERAAAAYQELIGEQLTEERTRKASLEQRGALVITTAGALVSLLFGLGAVVTSQKDFSVGHAASVLLLFGVSFFFIAAVAGLVANVPLRYSEVDPASLRSLVVPEYWDGPLSPGERNAANARLDVLEQARRGNQLKGWLVIAALSTEVIAVGFVAAAVGVILA